MRRAIVATAAISLAAVAVFITTKGPPPATPNPPNAFSFAVLGDAPYYWREELQHERVLDEIERHDLEFAIHVGDMFWRPCTDAHFTKYRDRFNAIRYPLVYTPGDNEWTDCWEPGSGSFSPRERLERLRQIFIATPAQSLGRRKLSLAHQARYVENARWHHQGIVFATVHIVGSRNGMRPFPTRTAADDAESRQRTEAAAAWVRETFAGAAEAKAVVFAFHANPFGDREALEPFLSTLEQEAERFGKPVLIVQGDNHEYIVDRPLRPSNITRLQVPGSPQVGWVRVVVRPDPAAPFTFEEHVVPRWKYW